MDRTELIASGAAKPAAGKEEATMPPTVHKPTGQRRDEAWWRRRIEQQSIRCVRRERCLYCVFDRLLNLLAVRRRAS